MQVALASLGNLIHEQAVTEAWPHLSHLDLSETKAGDDALSQVSHCKLLHVLRLRQCWGVGDRAVQLLAQVRY